MRCGCYQPFAGGKVMCARHYAEAKSMTPDKRATLLKAATLLVATALLVGGYIAASDWLAAVLS